MMYWVEKFYNLRSEYEEIKNRIAQLEQDNDEIFREAGISKSDCVGYVLNWGFTMDYDDIFSEIYISEKIANGQADVLIQIMKEIIDTLREEEQRKNDKNSALRRMIEMSREYEGIMESLEKLPQLK